MCLSDFLIGDFKDMQMAPHKDQRDLLERILPWQQLSLKNALEKWR